jgi:hypothetical protein
LQALFEALETVMLFRAQRKELSFYEKIKQPVEGIANKRFTLQRFDPQILLIRVIQSRFGEVFVFYFLFSQFGLCSLHSLFSRIACPREPLNLPNIFEASVMCATSQ